MWTLYRPLDLDNLPIPIYSHIVANPSFLIVTLKLNGNIFSQEQLAECPKPRVGFIVCGFKFVGVSLQEGDRTILFSRTPIWLVLPTR